MRRDYQGIGINTSKNTHEVIFSLMDPDRDSVIADIPTGSGAFVQRLKDQGYPNIYAIDIQNFFEADHDNFLLGNMNEALPLPDNSCDILICIDGIEHISRQFDFVKEVNRVLKKNGKFIFSTPNISSLRSRWKWLTTGHHHKETAPFDENHPSSLHHISLLSFPDIRYLLHTSGFKITRVLTNRIKPAQMIFSLFLPLIYPSMALTYRKQGKKNNTRKINREVFRTMFSKQILFGETTIIQALKSDR